MKAPLLTAAARHVAIAEINRSESTHAAFGQAPRHDANDAVEDRFYEPGFSGIAL